MLRPLFFILLLVVVACHAKTSFEYETNDDIESWGWEEGTSIAIEVDGEVESEGLGRIPVNVDSFGAIGDGVTDDTQAFVDAWNTSCTTKNAVFLVPEQKTYLVNATRFKGPCEQNLIINIAGTIVAPDEPEYWDPKNPRVWLFFTGLEKAWFQGGGTIDGSGSKWWASSCKINKTNPCRAAPTALTIDSSRSVWVSDLSIQNSQQMHFIVARSTGIRVTDVRVQSPSDSPNTDGIHITASTDVVVQDSQIGTGDDCISIVSGSSNIRIKNVECGPGHGISIGSLGGGNSTGMVSAVVVQNARLTGTTNGLRIKTWQGGSGYVRSVRYENVQMINVSNPIIIDQFYCDSSKPCENQTSAVKISQVIYRNIEGTSRTPKAIKFRCSESVPCSSIVLNNIYLQSEDDGPVETFCNCATGFGYGFVEPPADCLLSSDSKCAGAEARDLTEEDRIVHTEL